MDLRRDRHEGLIKIRYGQSLKQEVSQLREALQEKCHYFFMNHLPNERCSGLNCKYKTVCQK